MNSSSRFKVASNYRATFAALSRTWTAWERVIARPLVRRELAAKLRSPTSLGDPEELRGLFSAAGFENVRVLPRTKLLRFPPVAEFLIPRLAGGPAAEVVAQLSKEERAGLVVSVGRAMRDYSRPNGIGVPSDSSWLATV